MKNYPNRKLRVKFCAFLILTIFTGVISAQKLSLTIKTEKINVAELKALAKPANKKPVLINFWAT